MRMHKSLMQGAFAVATVARHGNVFEAPIVLDTVKR